MSVLDSGHRTALLAVARSAIESAVRSPFETPAGPASGFGSDGPSGAGALAQSELPALRRLGASFVTITVDGMLRGCIGSLEARLPLVEDVEVNARSAAFEDSRFASLEAEELGRMKIEISVLSPAEVIDARDRAELLASLRPGVDGVVVESGVHRATFLPQVWKSLAEPETFVSELAKKAGLPPAIAPPEAEFRRYTVERWGET